MVDLNKKKFVLYNKKAPIDLRDGPHMVAFYDPRDEQNSYVYNAAARTLYRWVDLFPITQRRFRRVAVPYHDLMSCKDAVLKSFRAALRYLDITLDGPEMSDDDEEQEPSAEEVEDYEKESASAMNRINKIHKLTESIMNEKNEAKAMVYLKKLAKYDD